MASSVKLQSEFNLIEKNSETYILPRNFYIVKINVESLGFIMFLQQANVINDVERDLIIDRAMALKQIRISIEEMRWITMMALWNKGREKDYAFVEDAVFNPKGLTIQ